MNDYQPTSTSETVPDSKPRPRRLPWSRRGRWISAAALALAATGISVGFAASGSTTAPSNSATTAAHFPRLAAGGAGSGGEPSNARSGPAAGGADGTVSDESTSSFTLTTSTGQKVTIDENSSTEYLNGDRLDFGERRHQRRKRPRARDDRLHDHHGLTGHHWLQLRFKPDSLNCDPL